MNKMYFYGCMGILAASAMLSSCISANGIHTSEIYILKLELAILGILYSFTLLTINNQTDRPA